MRGFQEFLHAALQDLDFDTKEKEMYRRNEAAPSTMSIYIRYAQSITGQTSYKFAQCESALGLLANHLALFLLL